MSVNMVGLSKKHQDQRDLLASLKEMNNCTRPETAALQHVKKNIYTLDGTNGIKETDLLFLKALMDSPVLQNLVKVQDRLEHPPPLPKPVSLTCRDTKNDIATYCRKSKTKESQELLGLLSRPHLKALLEIHDEVGQFTDMPKAEKEGLEVETLPEFNGTGETIRMVGLRKKTGQPLGLTVQVDESENLTVARILEGGMIDKQGLLHIGDIILEVNGVPVYTPEDLQTEIAKSKDSVTLKVGQAEVTTTHAPLIANGSAKNGVTKKLTCYMRALFEYTPAEDSLLPCKEIGLPFDRGDILQIVDQKDPNWWQAKKIDGDGKVGLIPSIELEERRKAFVAPDADYVHKISICGAKISKRKKKITYKTKSSSDFDKAELLLYEEVTKMPPFKRKTLVLIGSQGVGKRTIKNRLINSDTNKFGGIIPYTTRPQRVLEENGQSYWFTTREDMEADIKKHKFLEYGEYNGNLYGTHLDSLREVIKQGRMCVLDCSPQSLKILHNSSEFLPYVIFIASPGMEHLKTLYDVGRSSTNLRCSSRNLAFDRQNSLRYSSRRARTLESLASLYEEDDLKKTLEDSASMQRTYDQYIDLVIVNRDFDSTFRQVIDALENLSVEHQWVPVNWIY